MATTYKITNPKGEIKSGLTKQQVKEFKMALAKRNPPIVDPKAAGYIVEEEVEAPVKETGNRTSYEDRKSYFGEGASGALAETFPNLAEQYMQGNRDYNLGTVRAGLSDAFSLPGRTIASLANKSNIVGGGGEFNLGARGGEGTNLAGSIVRDPITGATTAISGPLASGVKGAAKIGMSLLGKAGRVIGGAGAGAVEGAGLEIASSGLKEGELPSGKDLVIGAGFGVGFEGVGQAINMLMQKYGNNLVDASVAALMKGNVNAHVTDAEKAMFLSNPNNMDALKQVLEQQTRGRNAFPLIAGGDRGKSLQKNVDNAFGEAQATIKNEPMLNDGDMGLELYQNKTVYKPGERKVEDLNYPHEPPAESRNFRSTAGKENKGLTKDFKYQSKAEYDLEKFADKYSGTWKSFEKMGTNQNPMSKDEQEFLDYLVAELDKDSKILSGYNPEYVLSSNKFLGDRMPFTSAELSKKTEALRKAHNSTGVSTEFMKELNKITSNATDNIGQNVANMINDAFTGRWNELERAFAYTDPNKDAPIYVRKGVKDAMDRFADALDSEALKSVGVYRKNSNGDMYGVSKDKAKKYYYQYLARLQETIANVKNGRHLTAESLAGLYSDATLHNDKAVQDAIIGLMEEMGISQEGIQAFMTKAGNYSMLHKAREAMKKPKKDDTLKGTMLNAVVPQEGFNFKNSLGYNLGYGRMGDVVGGAARSGAFGAERSYDIGDYR